MREKQRRLIVALLIAASVAAGAIYEAVTSRMPDPQPATLGVVSQPATQESTLASDVLAQLAVKGRAPKTGYERSKFSSGWGELNGCSLRELILLRDLQNTTLDEDGCRVLNGTLTSDPYSGQTIMFQRGINTSQAVQIDHVVAVSDAWQKGAQQLTPDLRYQFYNDPLNLLAVDGPTNNKKGDGDAATWLPQNKAYRCMYVARQVAVKAKYSLWVTEAEMLAIRSLLESCPEQRIPL